MPKKRVFFLGGIVLLLLIAWKGWNMYHQPRQGVSGQDVAQSLSAEQLYKQYQSQEEKSNRSFLGRVIEVTGVLSAVSQEGGHQLWVLSTGTAGAGVNCQLFENKQDINPKIGARYTIKGKCTGFLLDVNLVDCVVNKP